MTPDIIETIGNSRLQHGPLSNRVYLMHMEPADRIPVLDEMDRLAAENGYTKLFAKVAGKFKEAFESRGFEIEARIPDFYPDGDDALFVARFLSDDRAETLETDGIRQVLQTANAKFGQGVGRPLPPDYRPAVMEKADTSAMARLYRIVFETYPFPIFDPDYLCRTMEEDFIYFGIFHKGELVALSSAEMDSGGAEMTDFATHPDHRALGLGGHLLEAMESAMIKRGIKTAFTIARARLNGINILFSRARYAFAGTLINNTNISGRMESMNIWHKPL